jgi:hypothetical protein
MQVILNENQKRNTSVHGENKYTLGFRFAMAKNGRKRFECQVRCEVVKPLSNINSLIFRDYYMCYFSIAAGSSI